ncbi:MAG: hypothetical protein ACYTHJ_01295 [Planctomycetota bacterium]|jgi:hypothetical protein
MGNSPYPGVNRRCVACHYTLDGLGDEPRCPECGLLNIPDEYRKAVWKHVDKHSILLSPVLNPVAKRLPGWWWALDREKDLSLAMRRSCLHVGITALLLLATFVAADAFRERITTTITWNDPELGRQRAVYGSETYGLVGDMREFDSRSRSLEDLVGKPRTEFRKIGLRMQYAATTEVIMPKAIPSLWGVMVGLLVATWLTPATVGIWTQIRKGLPAYARPTRTVIAASLLESHRLVYGACLFPLFLAIDGILRLDGVSQPSYAYARGATMVLIGLPIVLASLGWIGPLRSDYTRQLIRSRKHAVRIILMYVVFFGTIFGLLLGVLINTVMPYTRFMNAGLF